MCCIGDTGKAAGRSILLGGYAAMAYCEWQAWSFNIIGGISAWQEMPYMKSPRVADFIVALASEKVHSSGVNFMMLERRALSTHVHCNIGK